MDTAAWIALLNSRDALHSLAVSQRKDLYRQNIPLMTTEFVLVEVADAFSDPPFRSKVAGFIEKLRREPGVEIVPVSSTLLESGFTLFKQRPDKEWSLTDCISFVVMESEGITTAFTSDHHFVQAGFQKLL